jgi:hypothetical protein
MSSTLGIKEKAGMLFEVLSPFIDSSQLSQAKNIAEIINAVNLKNSIITLAQQRKVMRCREDAKKNH